MKYLKNDSEIAPTEPWRSLTIISLKDQVKTPIIIIK